MVSTFQDVHDELYHRAKFGEIEQHPPAVGAKMWCLYVFVTLRGPRAIRSRELGYTLSRFCVTVYGLILIPFQRYFSDGLDSSHVYG